MLLQLFVLKIQLLFLEQQHFSLNQDLKLNIHNMNQSGLRYMDQS
jgi:hypothetical protein